MLRSCRPQSARGKFFLKPLNLGAFALKALRKNYTEGGL